MFLEAALEFAREASIYEARVHFLRRSSRRLSPSACNEFIKMPPPPLMGEPYQIRENLMNLPSDGLQLSKES